MGMCGELFGRGAQLVAVLLRAMYVATDHAVF